MITALDVANTFLDRAKKEKIDISPMKLQKLIYILYKVYLQKNGFRLFEERFEVWQYGPVVSSVYQVFKKFRSNRITEYYLNADGTYNTVRFHNNIRFDNAFEFVWEKYKQLDGVYLSQLTHQPDTAWSKADQRGDMYLDDQEIHEEEEYQFAI
ncbi:Panacea domain-containing protein [Streptococcus hyovaginalis]|uniref:Panacea domain-containing protein n=1 Tax=Streptococcus hyovaginalis TaxID=149015 RepID=UPI003ADC569F